MVGQGLVLVIKRLKRKMTQAGILDPTHQRPTLQEKIPKNLRHPY